MQRFALFSVFIALAALSSCQQPHKKEATAQRLTLVDSIKTAPILSEDNPRLEESISAIGTQVLRSENSVSLVYYSPKETALVYQEFFPQFRLLKQVRLRWKNAPLPQEPSSFLISGSQLYIWFNDDRFMLTGDTSGVLNRKVLFPLANESDQLFSGNDSRFLKQGDRMLMPVFTDAGEEHPNSVYSYCDAVFDASGDTAKMVGTAGRYPSHYLKEPVKLSAAYRVPMGDQEVLYVFQGADSICLCDLPKGTCTMKLLPFEMGHHFTAFPKDKLSDMQYILVYYKTAEQNLFAKYDDQEGRVYVLKFLGRKDLKAPAHYVLLVLDKELNKLAEIDLKDRPLYKDIFFSKDGFLYSGSLYENQLYKYQLQ